MTRAAKLHRTRILGIAFLGATAAAVAAVLVGHGRTDAAPAAPVHGASAVTGQGQGQGAVKGDWIGRIEQEMAESEYRINWQSRTVLEGLDSAYHAPNRAHGFRTYFTAQGIRVIPRTEETPSWEWSLTLAGVGRPGAMVPVAPASLRAERNRIEYGRGEVLEWYLNDPRGLEQGFTLRERPAAREAALAGVAPSSEIAESGAAGTAGVEPGAAAGSARASRPLEAGEVVLQLALGGTLSAYPSADGQAIDFATPEGARVVHYAELRVTDATGRELPSRMEGFNEDGARGIRLVFEDDGAVYPVTVDPLATSPAWTAESDQAGAQFGYSVATAGDVNGDGYADVIVGAYTYSNDQANEGRAFVYLGSASGLATTPAWTAESDQADAYFGFSVATAGDVNGDGYADVIVGAIAYDNGQTDEGRAFVYLGSASGLAASPAWTAESDQAGANFGYSVATAGDVNGDGYADVIVGAEGYNNGETYEGRGFVYLGSASGLATSPAWTAESDQVDAQFGYSVATAGDVNGDGYADVIIGAYTYTNGQQFEGRAFVYLGSASGLATSPAWTAESDQDSAHFGVSVATAGDVNGDGYADVIVGAYTYTNGGRAFVYLGSASGLATSPAWTAESDQANAYFGFSVATAGDVNGDGYADVIVGASAYTNGQQFEGRALVYLGSASGLATSSAWTAESNQANGQFGLSVGTAGDVNGDGYADVIVGAPFFANGQASEGRAFVYMGSASALGTSSAWTAESNQGSAYFGLSVATAGDVNGDGYADVIVGAYRYDAGQTDEGRAFVYLGSASGLAANPAWTAESNQANAYFGISAATAGDVNGDGYADVIVGAVVYDHGQTNEGRAFVYLGSASGLAATPAWTAESNQASAFFGHSVATAGDVNGDGYADVIVGANGYVNDQSNEGRAFVYLGSASGLATSPAWTAESNQAISLFGISVATAGDVNGDGYSDVIVGAYWYDNGETDEGRAFVYLGSASGLATSPAWTAEGNQVKAWFGYSVATAGDVNGDGYADVIVGAYSYDNGQPGEGGAFVYLGSASGLAASPAWTGESDQVNADFGASVATAGDVNGDGYADVIVGANQYTNGQLLEGRAFVYLGSASGLASTPAWTAESNQTGADFGVSVATAGDVNGDGYADVIVGAQGFYNGQGDEGGAFVYYGNGGPGLSLRPQQRRASDIVPIAHLGASDALDSFRLALLGRSPFGRGRARLEWEVKPLGSLLNGASTTVGASDSDTGVGGVSLSALSTGLSIDTAYHWRVRLRYNPATTPFAQRSRWLTVPWNGWQEADLRTAAPGAGRVPSGSPAQPLLVSKAAPNITLTWDPSCNGADSDYTIYEGTLGSFYSHKARFCSTGGTTTKTFTPQSGNSYYLVVPLNAWREGSYGTRSGGSERPAGTSVCLPQAIATCP